MRPKPRGVTLIEVLISAVLLGSVILCARIGFNFINSLMRQKGTAEIRRDAQNVTYALARDIRNASEIKEVDFDKLVLSSFDTSHYQYDQPQLFSSVNIGTITYQYKNVAGEAYLEKTVQFPSNGGTSTTNKLLRRFIIAPDPVNYLFKGGPNLTPPYDSVEIIVRLQGPFATDDAIVYREMAMRRNSIQ